jgi:multidrug efflux pump subunit AcrA (membrane-fusion protein)
MRWAQRISLRALRVVWSQRVDRAALSVGDHPIHRPHRLPAGGGIFDARPGLGFRVVGSGLCAYVRRVERVVEPPCEQRRFTVDGFRPPRGRISLGGWMIGGIGLLSLLLGGVGCGNGVAVSGTGAGENEPRPVETVRVTPRPLDRTLTVLGTFTAKQEAELSAKVPGRLQSIAVDLGSEVRAGEILAEVEPRDYELQLRQAEAALAQARATLGLPAHGTDDEVELEQTTWVREARAVFEQARSDRDRAEQLRVEGILSTSEHDAAEAAYQVALNRYEAALEAARQRRATVAERRIELEISRQQLDDARIAAPFDGRVQRRHANPGQYLKTGDPLIRLVQVNPLRLQMEVPEREASQLRLGQEVRFRATGLEESLMARVSRISPALDRTSRVLLVEADVENDGRLQPGSFAEASIVVRRDPAVLMVPTRALRVFAGMEKVFVATDHEAVERDVVTGQAEDGWIEIRQGIESGESVILDPGGLRNGEAIAIGYQPET